MKLEATAMDEPLDPLAAGPPDEPVDNAVQPAATGSGYPADGLRGDLLQPLDGDVLLAELVGHGRNLLPAPVSVRHAASEFQGVATRAEEKAEVGDVLPGAAARLRGEQELAERLEEGLDLYARRPHEPVGHVQRLQPRVGFGRVLP